MTRLLLAFVLCLPAAVAAGQPAKTVKVTVLSTMLVGNSAAGIGESGFAAVLEVDGHRLLIDTGARAETVLKNAAELNVDLSTITDLVLTRSRESICCVGHRIRSHRLGKRRASGRTRTDGPFLVARESHQAADDR